MLDNLIDGVFDDMHLHRIRTDPAYAVQVVLRHEAALEAAAREHAPEIEAALEKLLPELTAETAAVIRECVTIEQTFDRANEAEQARLKARYAELSAHPAGVRYHEMVLEVIRPYRTYTDAEIDAVNACEAAIGVEAFEALWDAARAKQRQENGRAVG